VSPATRRAGALGGVLFLAALGVLFADPGLLVVAVVPLAYVAFDAVSGLPGDPRVEVTRSFAPADPPPGGTVEVTLDLHNPTGSTLPDVRVVDAVPSELAVVDGSPRAATSLRAGGSAELTYEVVAKRGEYRFGEPTVRLRSLSALRWSTADVPAAGETVLECTGAAPEPPMPAAARYRPGTLPTDRGGSGVEFHSVREYRHGDPLRRIDWRRYAKSRELGTVEFRQERAVRIVLLVDARGPARVVPRPGYPTGTELSAYAARRLYESLRGAGHAADVAALGLSDADLDGGLDPDGLAWAGSDDDRDPMAVLEAAGRVGPGGNTAGSGDDRWIQAVLARLPPNAHVVPVSPLVDDPPVDLVRSLAVHGHPFTLVSPDVSGGGSVAGRVERTERAARAREVATVGGAVVDWDVERPLGLALRESLRHLLDT